jgi:hypothetical protein
MEMEGNGFGIRSSIGTYSHVNKREIHREIGRKLAGIRPENESGDSRLEGWLIIKRKMESDKRPVSKPELVDIQPAVTQDNDSIVPHHPLSLVLSISPRDFSFIDLRITGNCSPSIPAASSLDSTSISWYFQGGFIVYSYVNRYHIRKNNYPSWSCRVSPCKAFSSLTSLTRLAPEVATCQTATP